MLTPVRLYKFGVASSDRGDGQTTNARQAVQHSTSGHLCFDASFKKSWDFYPFKYKPKHAYSGGSVELPLEFRWEFHGISGGLRLEGLVADHPKGTGSTSNLASQTWHSDNYPDSSLGT